MGTDRFAEECLSLLRERIGGIGAELATVVRQLDLEDLAWRPNDASNSATNLVLHICGDLRLRVQHGIGGATVVRDAHSAFTHRDPVHAAELAEMITSGFAEADTVLAALPPDRLLQAQTVRNRPTTHLQVLVNVVSHLSGHLGQVIYIAKARLGDRFDPW